MILVENLIDKKKLSIKLLRKIRALITLYIFVFLMIVLLWAAAIAVYGYFSIINNWYNYSIFFYFIYPIYTFIWVLVSLLVLSLTYMFVSEKVKSEEISTVVFTRKKTNKIKNIFTDIYFIWRINKIIRLLKKNKTNIKLLDKLIIKYEN